MKLKFSPKSVEKFKRDGITKLVINYLRDSFLVSSIVEYVIDWRYASTRVNLVEWLNKNLTVPNSVKSDLSDLYASKSSDLGKLKQVLYYVHNNLEYVSDQTKWGVEEKWEPIEDVWRTKKADCESGAQLIYAIAKWLGITDDHLFLVCGDVAPNGGHCYVVYYSEEDLCEYTFDWCFHFDISKLVKVPYAERSEYFGGSREWFRFNASGSFRPRDLI